MKVFLSLPPSFNALVSKVWFVPPKKRDKNNPHWTGGNFIQKGKTMLKTKLIIVGAALAAIAFANCGEFTETFDYNPVESGWRLFGNQSLFSWNSVDKNLRVIWDSSKPNSYFYKPLGTTLTRDYFFVFGFDLKLDSVAVGTTPGKPFTFQLAIGLINYTNATNPNFLRGTGMDSPNVVEFDYFPDSGFGATISPVIISASNEFAVSFNFPIELATGTVYRVDMIYLPESGILKTSMKSNGVAFVNIKDAVIPSDFAGFFVDTFAICSYSDEGQDPIWGGSILASGVVDNINMVWYNPYAPTLEGSFAANAYKITIESHQMWWYTLERSDDLKTWSAVSPPTPGTGGKLTLIDTTPPSEKAFYRVKAEKLSGAR